MPRSSSPRASSRERASAFIDIGEPGTGPIVRANRVRDGPGFGIYVSDGASPLIEENEIWATAFTGIQVGDAGTNPLVQTNRIRSAEGGIFACDGPRRGLRKRSGRMPRLGSKSATPGATRCRARGRCLTMFVPN